MQCYSAILQYPENTYFEVISTLWYESNAIESATDCINSIQLNPTKMAATRPMDLLSPPSVQRRIALASRRLTLAFVYQLVAKVSFLRD